MNDSQSVTESLGVLPAVAQVPSLDSYEGQRSTEKKKACKPELTEHYKSWLNRPHTAARAVLYPDCEAEMGICHSSGGRGRPVRQSTAYEKKERSIRRAKLRIQQLCRFNEVLYLWTFTHAGPLSYKEFQKIFRRFLRLIEKEIPDFDAITIPEVHPGDGANHGGYHAHAGVSAFYPVTVMRSCWYQALEDYHDAERGRGRYLGEVDVQAPPAGIRSVRMIANYMAKYLEKSMGDLFDESYDVKLVPDYQHFFWVTKGFRMPNLDEPKNKKKKFGFRRFLEFRGSRSEREARLMGHIFAATGKVARVVWRSKDGNSLVLSTRPVDAGVIKAREDYES